MIKGTVKTEASYRAIVMDSSSSLKEFSQDRKKYYRKYVLGEKVEDDDSKAATMGRLVETKLMEPELFDEKFYLSTCQSVPTGLMLDFVEALYKHMKEATNESGEITREFGEVAQDAYKDSGFKITYDAVMKKFIDSEAEAYFDEIMLVRSKGMTVVSINDVTNCENIVTELRTNPFTASIVNQDKTSRYDVYNQLQVENYQVHGHKFKSMMDKVIVDHHTQTIQIYDLKCTWSVEGFYKEYYLYRRAYIQAFLYWHAGHFHFQDLVDKGYKVKYPSFIVCDSTNYFSPLIYTLDTEDMENARDGFNLKGYIYPGVLETIDNLKWAIENDTWNISRNNYLNGGIVNIKG
jgi:hypothetical protein